MFTLGHHGTKFNDMSVQNAHLPNNDMTKGIKVMRELDLSLLNHQSSDPIAETESRLNTRKVRKRKGNRLAAVPVVIVMKRSLSCCKGLRPNDSG